MITCSSISRGTARSSRWNRSGYTSAEADGRAELAEMLRHSGDLAAARELYESALTIGTELRVAYLVADARAGLGALQDATSGSVVRTVTGGETMVA